MNIPVNFTEVNVSRLAAGLVARVCGDRDTAARVVNETPILWCLEGLDDAVKRVQPKKYDAFSCRGFSGRVVMKF